MDKVRLNVLGLSYSQTQSGAYALVLSEENGDRRVPIIIGGYEAQAIAIELEGLKPPRPLTHDLFLSMSKAVGVEVTEVNIYKLEEGIFFSELIVENNGVSIRIDARTSDAIALALRFKCPIFTTEDILQKAGIVIDMEKSSISEPAQSVEDKKESKVSSKKTSKYSKYNLVELQELLQLAIEEEDYEKASEVRDEIQKRKEE